MDKRIVGHTLAICIALALAGCGGGGGDASSGRTYNTVGGAVQLSLVNNQSAGLPAGLVLSDGNESFTVPAGATSFSFPTGLGAGDTYNVTVVNSPSGLNCAVTAPSGTMARSAVNNVRVNCSDASFQLGGNVSGMRFGGGVQLTNGTDTIVLTPSTVTGAGGNYTVSYTPCTPASSAACQFSATWKFPNAVPFGTPYNIQIQGQSLVQCALGNGGGTVGPADISDVSLTCTTPQLGILAGAPGFLPGNGMSNSGTGIAGVTFGGLSGVAMDASGVVYVTNGYVITKITPDGTVMTLAGSGAPGATNGQGSQASFGRNNNIALDASGNVYVADRDNKLIRKIDSGGNVTTLVGLAAGLQYPEGIAVDASGNIYVADATGSSVSKFDSRGVRQWQSSTAGGALDGPVTSATFTSPGGLAVDSAGKVYVVDGGNNTIRVIDISGNVTTLAGHVGPNGVASGNANGPGASATFNGPENIAVDSVRNVAYVTDTGNFLIRKIDLSSQMVTTLAGSGMRGSTNGVGAAASISDPNGICLDASGNLYVTDEYSQIRKITPAGVVSTFAGASVAGAANGLGNAASFYWPNGVAVDDSNNVYVADNSKIRKITPAGVVSVLAGSEGLSPFNLVTYTSSGAVTLYTASLASIQMLSPTGTVSTLALNTTNSTVIAIDTSGNLYFELADPSGGIMLVRKSPQSSTLTTVARGYSTGGATLSGLAVATSGRIYIADGGTSIRLITSAASGANIVFAGSATPGTADGQGTAATFTQINALAVDPAGNLYVADGDHLTTNLIRKITPSGLVTTLAGTVGYGGPTRPSYLPGGIEAPMGIAFSKPDPVTGHFNLYFTTGNAVAEIVNVDVY